MVSGTEAQGARWNSYVEKAAAGSVHAAEMPFVDAGVTTGSVSGAGISAPGIGTVALRGKGAANEVPDELRINRADKQGRIVKVAPVAPPKSFNAGSVFERTSSLLLPKIDNKLKMAFAKPAIKGREIEIAAAFHAKQEKRLEPGVPVMLASLVNNNPPDVLATAYVPAEPDYAKASPFESLLQEEDPNKGRFIPPVANGDHDWIRSLCRRLFSPRPSRNAWPMPSISRRVAKA